MRCSTALVALLGAVGCRSLPHAVQPDAVEWRASLLRMEDTRRIDAQRLEAAMRVADPRIRRAAALSAGRLGARAQAGLLRELTADQDPRVASAAFYALGLLKDTAAAEPARGAIRGAVDVAIDAAWLLGAIGEAGRAPLLAAALDSALSGRTRGAALLALARVTPLPSAPLLPLLGDRDTAVAWRAAYVVARSRNAGAVRAMIAATQSSSTQVRDYAARGLTRALAGDSLGAQALDALRRLSVDSSVAVRVTAVRVLGGYGPAAAPAIATALRDRHPSVRVTAASLAHLALDSSTVSWERAWQFDTSFVVRAALAQSAVRRGMLSDRWSVWRTDTAWRRRALAATLDAQGSALPAVQRLERYLRDPDGRVRASAVEALATLADSADVTAGARRRLRAVLHDSDFVVRANALGALARQAMPADLAAALDAFPASRGDVDLDARLAFWALADSAIRRSGPLPDSIARLLDALPRPSDPLERSRASSIPRFRAWLDSTSPPRAEAWYRERAREALSSRHPVAVVTTDRGPFDLELFAADAPITVANFVSLARRRYFDGQTFHRVVPNFVVQAGDPRGDGNGGPGYAIRDELNPHRYERGTLGMALSGPDTGGSQWFVTHAAQPHLDGGYTVFGQLLHGGDVLDRIVQGDHIVRITIR